MSSNGKQRTFEHGTAVSGNLPLLVGIYGPSGGGKTHSALRVATGMQRVYGGKIFVIDTESGRARHYAPKPGERPTAGSTFDFQHVPFSAPFGPLDYLAALEYCVAQGARVVVVDSASHEHEGPGGVLEQHAAEHERMGGKEGTKFLAWSKPKAARRRLINTVLQLPCATVWCFRAKEKLEIRRGEDPLKLGWMPIGGEEFIFEMTVRALLEPGADGVPTWAPTMPGEKEIVRVPKQFRPLLNAQGAHPLCEDDGEAMARWAAGDSNAIPDNRPPSVPPAGLVFRGKKGGTWTGRPLADAPLDVLRDYRVVIAKAAADAKDVARRDYHSAHLDDVDAAIEAAEADEELGGYDEETGEVRPEAAV
jgi:hypothetical protein